MKIKGAFTVRWASQDGKPGANGNSARSVYMSSYDKPTTPTGNSPAGWAAGPQNDSPVIVRKSGNWYTGNDGYLYSPIVGNRQISALHLVISCTEANKTVHFRAKASTTGEDRMVVWQLDGTTTAMSTLTGASKDTGDKTFTLPDDKPHTLTIWLERKGGTTSYAKINLGPRPIWRSDAVQWNAAGQVTKWTEPVCISDPSALKEESFSLGANLIRQSAFSSLDAWGEHKGNTSEGIEGRAAFSSAAFDESKQIHTVLRQAITHKEEGRQAIATDKWHTLSFYARKKPYFDLIQSITSSAYGFAYEKCYFAEGVASTVSIECKVSQQAVAAGYSLVILVYADGWTWSAGSGQITDTTNSWHHIPVKVPKTGVYNISAYLGKNGAAPSTPASGAQTATVSRYRIDRGGTLYSYFYPVKTPAGDYSFVETTAGRKVDGVWQPATPGDMNVRWVLSEEWTRHAVTFRTKSDAPDSEQQVLFRLDADSNGVDICMPKLEEGMEPTPWCAADDDTSDKAMQETGFPNDRGIWVQSPSPLYRWDNMFRDYVAKDIDGEFYTFFVKRKGMTVPAGAEPVAGGNQYWEQGSIIRTLITNTIIGQNARIGGFMVTDEKMKSTSGNFELDGNAGTMRISQQNGGMWGLMEDGRQVSGQYTDEGNSGEHIEINPNTGEVTIHDSSGAPATTLSGKVAAKVSDIFGSSAKELSKTALWSGGVTKTTIGTEETEKVVEKFSTTSAVRLFVSGKLTTSVSKSLYNPQGTGAQGVPVIQDPDGKMYVIHICSVQVIVKTYTDEASYNRKDSPIDAQSIGYLPSNTGRGQLDRESTLSNVSVNLQKGYHVLSVQSINTVYGGTTDGKANTTYQLTRVGYNSDVYLSRMLANGVAYGSSKDNYFLALNVDGGMVVSAMTRHTDPQGVTSVQGYELDKNGLSLASDTYRIRQTVCLAIGEVHWFGSTPELLTYVSGIRGISPCTVERTGVGTFKITFPQEWQNLPGFGVDTTFIQVTGAYSGQKIGLASVGSRIDKRYCTVYVGDDMYPNDNFDFWFSIHFMLP